MRRVQREWASEVESLYGARFLNGDSERDTTLAKPSTQSSGVTCGVNTHPHVRAVVGYRFCTGRWRTSALGYSGTNVSASTWRGLKVLK